MANDASSAQSDFRIEFIANEQQVRIDTGKIACVLVILLMPLGMSLDYFVYPGRVLDFLALRLLCSTLVGVLWLLHHTSFARRHYWMVGLPIVILPAFFITWMIHRAEEGAASPYYAGLNLILLAVSSVGHWSFLESLAAVGSVILMYSVAYWVDPAGGKAGLYFNNLYFLVLTGIIVVTGNVLFNRLRLSEFKLGLELKDANRKLRELDEVKSRFFANISHELRTPLTLLLAPLETLLHQSGRILDESTRDLLATMHANGMRLLKLINDLLDLVRLESGRMEVKREPLHVAGFIQGLASAARQVAEDKRIQLTSQIDPGLSSVLADRDKLEKVILNLVFNALKFTPAGGRVEMRADKQNNHFVLAVSDTGMGIAEKNLPFIFDRFWQADTSSKRKYQGVGIGLALVKELVELQGGQVGVESQEGHGTVFTIRLPYMPAEVAPPSEPSGPVGEELSEVCASKEPRSEEWLTNLYRRAELFPALTLVHESLRPVESWSNGDRPRVLIADDEPDMLRFLKSQLADKYQVLEAVDGQQAIEKTCQFLPDIVLLDMMMPEKNGVQACLELRERTPTQSIPIVLLTARADEDTKLAALKAGASDFLTKPFSTTELRVRIKNLVESYEYQRKVARQNHLLERTIEQLKETETQLVESEKMRSLGRLSAGIIHEINNPLNFATTGLFSLRRKDKCLAENERPEFLEILGDVEDGIKRVKDLVSKMREFSYADNQQLDNVEVAEVLTSALRFLCHEWKGKVAIHQEIPEGQTIWANKNRMTQVLLNLIQNSLDSISRKTCQDEESAIWVKGWTAPDRSLLVIRDNGAGIAPEHMDKIFDPFFTTKEVGQGMGLGLSICYRIIQDCGGRINVKSEPGHFCEFELEFAAHGPPVNTPAGRGDDHARTVQL